MTFSFSFQLLLHNDKFRAKGIFEILANSHANNAFFENSLNTQLINAVSGLRY